MPPAIDPVEGWIVTAPAGGADAAVRPAGSVAAASVAAATA
jgi:hypothetical protein